MSYAVFFSDGSLTLRLPVNPEEIDFQYPQEVNEYKVLKLGNIAVPGVMGLATFKFEVELPGKLYPYVVTPNEFKPAPYYIEQFNKWRSNPDKKPLRFICNNYKGSSANCLVLVKDIKLKEKAGEEGDYYASFDLIEYVPYKVQEGTIEVTIPSTGSTETVAKVSTPKRESNPPKPNDKIHVVQKGDTMFDISKKYYGSGSSWKKLWEHNKGNMKSKNPNLIYPGEKVRLY